MTREKVYCKSIVVHCGVTASTIWQVNLISSVILTKNNFENCNQLIEVTQRIRVRVTHKCHQTLRKTFTMYNKRLLLEKIVFNRVVSYRWCN